MADLRIRIEKGFEDFTRNIYRHRLKYLITMVALIGIMCASVFNLTVDTATESMLHDKDPSLLDYNAYREQFGRTDIITILIESPDIFAPEFIGKLKRLHDDIEETVPFLSKVRSLVTIRDTYEENGTLYVEELMRDFEKRDLEAIKKRALENPFYVDYILSSDKKSTAIMIETVATVSDEPANPSEDPDIFEEDGFSDEAADQETNKSGWHYINADEKAEVNAAVLHLIGQYQTADFSLTFSGAPVVVDVFNKTTADDTRRLMKIMTLVIIVFLYLLFRRISGVILPLVIVNTSMASTLGLMAHTGTPISLMTNVLPGFLVAVGIASSVHVLAIFYREFQNGKSKEEAICYAMGHSGLAIVMTSITTAAGLLSFSIAEIATIAEMGYFAAAGVILALIFTIILLPSLISLTPIHQKKESQNAETDTGKKSGKMDCVLLFFVRFSTRYPIQIVAISLLFFIISVVFITRLEFSSFVLSYFPENHPVKADLKHLESKLGGSVAFEVVIDTGEENGLHNPEILNSIERLTVKIGAIQNDRIHVGKIVSINDIVKETHQALHDNRKAYYRIPQDRNTIAQELLLFENGGAEDLEQICDNRFRKTRLSIRTMWADSVFYNEFLDELNAMFQAEFGERATVTVTGLSAIMARTIPAALKSMLESYIIALVVITIMMLILVGDIKLGLLSMNPNLLPIFMVMGLIRISGLHLDINTLFIGSIALGLVVDDTIHFMYNFKKYYDLTGSTSTAIRETLLGTGRAMLITSIVLALNFFVLLTATLNHSIKFGLFTGLAIVLALFADFLLAPALMVLATGRKKGETVLEGV